MPESEDKLLVPVGQDLVKDITDQDLVRDAKKIVEQSMEYYLPGEVEITVLISRPGQTHAVAVCTNVQEAERLRWLYQTAKDRIPLLALRKTGKL